jgi:putative ABC transport system ATP-binding protein
MQTLRIFFETMDNKSLISVRNLSHSFGKNETKHTVLHNVSLDFYPGETVIIMGPSGAGKTTLLTLVGALRSPQSGSIEVCGIELQNAGPRQQLQVRQHIGFIFQAHNLLDSLTVVENVQMGLAHLRLPNSESRRKSKAMLRRVGLEKYLDKCPRHLSIGQRQRVAIARGLVRSPSIIIADEPTASLDSHIGREIVDLLHCLCRQENCAVLMVTHDSRILDIADRILTLEDGYIAESSQIIDRIGGKLISVMEQILQYLTLFNDQEKFKELRQNCRETLTRERVDISAFVTRKMNELLTEKTALLHSAVENVIQLEDATAHFCNQMKGAPTGNLLELTDSLFQSLEFLFITTVEALASNSSNDITHLLKLTSDKSDLMEQLRKRYIKAGSTATEKEQAFIFNLTQSFAIIVRLLHSLAETWQ